MPALPDVPENSRVETVIVYELFKHPFPYTDYAHCPHTISWQTFPGEQSKKAFIALSLWLFG